MKRHVNIPIFIPHLGCPNQCVFCNQRTISGVQQFEAENVIPEIEAALSTVDEETAVEIAFFGGSFTGIDRSLMIELLEIASSYVKDGKVHSIRCSTRPDYIDNDVLAILKRYGVGVIELGLQSISDEVLRITKRGHTSEDSEKACRAVVEWGFDLVGQMMVGLPGSDAESELKTADFIIRMGAVGARIYPTVVFHSTELCYMAQLGEYIPLGLSQAVKRSVKVLKRFLDAGVKVIRIGLCASENLAGNDTYYAGPNHPALGELVENQLYYENIADRLNRLGAYCGKKLTVFVAPGTISKAIGQRRVNKHRLIQEFGLADVKFREEHSLTGYELKLDLEREAGCI